MLLFNYDAVEGGEGVSETDEKVGRGWQCLSILIDGCHNEDGDGGICFNWGMGDVPPCR